MAQATNEIPKPFHPTPHEGFRLSWWTLATKKQTLIYMADKPGLILPSLGKASVLVYSSLDAAINGINFVLIGNSRDPRTKNSEGVKLYTIEHWVKA